MPLRRRLAPRAKSFEVDPSLFEASDGTWSFFDDEPVYSDRASAERAWHRARRQVWSSTHLTRIPRAAQDFDGLTTGGRDALWSGWNQKPVPIDEILSALAEDRDAVAAFRAADPRGASAIGDFLDLWLAQLDRWEHLAREFVACHRWNGLASQVFRGSEVTYGAAVRATTARPNDCG
jgi:hypothetical protein